MNILTVSIKNIDENNFIFGQSHFIKTVEDLYEVCVASVPGIKFGLAFCEASTDRLIRTAGTDEGLIQLAAENASAVGAGHTFFLFLGQGYYPINILNAVKNVSEVCNIYCATANPVEVILAESTLGRGVLGVIDGQSPLGIETETDAKNRQNLLRRFGYKQG
ncbi:MAG TPA: adenosine-specific kinase [Anaerolineaceae bacterium]|nr:adenosine-specific kinase [Anaerolineaceae bacterium]